VLDQRLGVLLGRDPVFNSTIYDGFDAGETCRRPRVLGLFKLDVRAVDVVVSHAEEETRQASRIGTADLRPYGDDGISE